MKYFKVLNEMPHVPLQTRVLGYVILDGILVSKYTNLPRIQCV